MLNANSAPTLQQAIGVFSLSMATLPGASTSNLPAGTGFSATMAMAMIAPFYAQLTPQQKAVVDSFEPTVIATVEPEDHRVTPVTSGTAPPVTTTGPGGVPTSATGPGGATTSATGPSALRRPAGLLEMAPPAAQDPANAPTTHAHDLGLLQQTLNDWRAYRPDLIGRPGGFELAVSTVEPKNNAEMDARPDPARPKVCLITLYPTYTNGTYTDNTAKYVFAHELFHCIQFTWSDLDHNPEWLVEGSAEYAALDLYRSSFQPIPTEAFDGWFIDTARPLGQDPAGQGYNDWALFEAFKEHFKGDTYAVIETMIKTDGSTAAILTAGGMTDPIFATLWTSTALRSTDYPDDVFQLPWPGLLPDYGPHDTATYLGSRGIGTFAVVGKGDFVHQAYTVGFDPTVGVVGVTPVDGPLLTETSAGPMTVGEGQQAWFCVRPAGCTCPDGSALPVSEVSLAPPMLFSFDTAATASSASVAAFPWDEQAYCRTPTPIATPIPPPTGFANGDPHVTTFNGLSYDFMTYGEFVTSQDTTGGFVLQERHAPAGFGTAISAVAVGDGTHRITITASGVDPDAPITVRIDGRTSIETTATAGTLTLHAYPLMGPEWTISWPDGSVVDVRWAAGFFLTVVPSSARGTHLVGLLGKPSPTFLNDLSLPDGQHASPMDHYRSFADAYRVTAATTLFDYDAGQSVGSFDTPPPDLPPVAAPTAQAVQTCRAGLGDTATASEIDDCAYDITSMGNAPAYIAAYSRAVQQRTARIVDSPGASPASPIVVGSEPGAPPTTQSAPPSGGASLTLTGTLVPDPDRSPSKLPGTLVPDGSSTLTGTMSLVAGTVLVWKAQCPADPNIDVSAALTNTQSDWQSEIELCGSGWRNGDQVFSDDAVANTGEDYVLIYPTGEYSVSVRGRNDDPGGSAASVAVSVQLDSSTTPTVIRPQGADHGPKSDRHIGQGR